MDATMIRSATSGDLPAIRAILRNAFGQDDEANLVEQLRADGDVLVELVAASDIALQGHILYSPLKIERDGETMDAAALAPVSVLPAFQRAGIGKALIRAGNAACADLGLPAIIVLGHPDYYPQFGFSPDLTESLEAPFSGPAFMALELWPDALKAGGRVRYAKAFGV
ncbi:acetyltransferase [alpha proteobacterium U9-1i]|nr:acetyltransferase [alpha proteobacterium U9-1i]